MADKHIADGEAGFQAVNSTPDVCKVGLAIVPFDCFQRLSSEKQYSATVRARGFSVLNVGSVISGTQSNAGSGVVSGTSLGSGDCIILTGSPTVRVEGRPVARHNSDVGMNNLNCLGKIQTLVAPPVVIVKDNTLPCNNPPVTSPTLEALIQDRQNVSDSLLEKLRQAVDVSKAIDSTDKWTKEQIDKLRPVSLPEEAGQTVFDPETGMEIPVEVYNARNEINAGIVRGILGFGRSAVSGIASLANSAEQYLLQDPRIKVLDSLILAENIRLGNVCAEGIREDTKETWDKLSDAASKAWNDFQDKWDKASPGDKTEIVTRAMAEIATLPWVAAKAGTLGKIGKAGKLAKGAAVVEDTGDIGSAVRKLDDIAPVVDTTQDAGRITDDVSQAGKAKDGVKVVRTAKQGAAFGEKRAHEVMQERGMTPVGKTDGIYRDGLNGIDGVYRHPNPPPDYIIMEAKYNKAKLEKGLADGTNQMDDKWVRKRLQDHVSPEEADKIRRAMNRGSVEKWKVQVKPDGSTSISKIDEDGNVIRGNKGKVE